MSKTIQRPSLAKNMNNFPDSILLEIFSYLSVKERCLSDRVCKRWRCVLADNTLWRHVNMLEYTIGVTQMWKITRAHFSPCLVTLKISGFSKETTTRKRKKTSITESMMKELGLRCPNLTVLHLKNCDTEDIPYKSLPTSLQSLSITHSAWKPRWFKVKPNHLANLHTLDLSDTVRIDAHDLIDVNQMTGLKHLSLSGCYRLRENTLQNLSKTLTQLEYLDISCILAVNKMDITNLALHHISRNLVNLKELVLSGNMLDDASISTISSCCRQLTVIHFNLSGNFTLEGLRSLCNLENLKFIRINTTKHFKGKLLIEDVENIFGPEMKVEFNEEPTQTNLWRKIKKPYLQYMR